MYAQRVEAADILSARFSDDLAKVDAELCLDGRAPDRLYRNSQSDDWSDGIYLADRKLRTSGRHGEIHLPDLPEDACIHWQVDFRTALKTSNYRVVSERGNDLVMSADVWFWKASRSRDLIVNVKVPDGMSFSTPWALIERSGQLTTYRPDSTPAIWESRLAIGRFKLQTIDVPGAQIRLAALGDLTDQQNEKFRLWIKESVLAVASVFGSFPQSQPQVLVIPVGKRRESTLGAQVIRGGGMAVILVVDENQPLEEFTGDWTATHEFSHMLVPYISSRDRWLSEGLASYYQNVLRARNGRLTETQAWQKLYEGFKRGENGTHGGSLAQATRSGWRSTMRVYWSGAALMLMADMQLRETSGGLQSLDTALQSLSACCMDNGKTWRAREMFSQLDALTGTGVFTALYKKYVHEEGFPDMRSTWENLGINTRHDRVSLSEDAPMAGVRSAIMKG